MRLKFPLDMGNEIYVRELEALKENYNSEKVAEYFLNGRLLIWLTDRYYDVEAEQVRALTEQDDKENLAAKLGKIFGVEVQEDVDVEKLEIRREKLEKLRLITSDDNILDNADFAAFSQEELGDLLDESAETIYLCGETFRIPSSVKNVRYIGVNKPVISVSGKDSLDLEALGIVFENCIFSEETEARIVCRENVESVREEYHQTELWYGINGNDDEHRGVLAVHEAFGYNQDMANLMVTDKSYMTNFNMVNEAKNVAENIAESMNGTKNKKVTAIILCPPSWGVCYNFSVDNINDVAEIFSVQYDKVVEYMGNHPTVSDRFDNDTINKIIGSGAVYVIDQHSPEIELEKQMLDGTYVSNYANLFAPLFADDPVKSTALSLAPGLFNALVINNEGKDKAADVRDNGGVKYVLNGIDCKINNAQEWKITIKISADRYSEFADKFTVPLVYFKGAKEFKNPDLERSKETEKNVTNEKSEEFMKELRKITNRINHLGLSPFSEKNQSLNQGWVGTAKTKSLEKYKQYQMQPLILVNMRALFACMNIKTIDKGSGLKKSAVGVCEGFFTVEFN